MNRRWAIAVLLGVLVLILALPFVGGYLRGSAHDCPPVLFVDEASPDEVDSPPVQFSDLSERRQREFESALAGDRPEIGSTEDAWIDTRFVRYRDANYSTAVAVC